MEVIAGLIPLDLHIMELAARSRVRTKPLVKDRWDGIDGSQKGPGEGRWPSKILGQVHRRNREVGGATSKGKLMDRVGIPERGGRTYAIFRGGRKQSGCWIWLRTL